MPGPSKYLAVDPTNGIHREYAGGTANGLVPADAGGLVPLANMQVRTAQVTRAARPALVTAGGSFSAFLATVGGPDATDGSWEAVYVEGFAPIGGILATALTTYLRSLGLTSGQAATQIASIWTAAASITP